MTKRWAAVVVLAAVMALGGLFYSLGAGAPATKQEELVKQLSGEGVAAAARTPAELRAAYDEVLPKLLEKPEASDVALEHIAMRASRPGAEGERMALSAALAARLRAEGATPAVRVLILRHLGRVGGDEVVPAITPLLGDRDELVPEAARRALANMATPAAAQAIRGEMDKAEDSAWRGAMVGALAHRREAGDAATFARAAGSSDEAVRIPALAALARTGDASAAPILAAARETGSDRAKAAANDAYLLLAGRLVASGDREAGAKIYREYLGTAGKWRYAGIVGLGEAGTREDVIKMLDLLGDPDVRARGAVLAVLARRHEAGAADRVAERLGSAEAGTKPWLLRALVALGDARAKEAMLRDAGDENVAVRLAAINGLAKVGDASAVAPLLKSAAAKGEEQVAARNTLQVLAAAGVDEALLAGAKIGESPVRVEAIRALGVRRSGAAVETLFGLAADGDEKVRREAMRSLGLVAGFDQLPRAVGLVVNAMNDADREEAGKAAVAIARKSDDLDARSGPVLAELAKTEGAAHATLLGVAGQLGGERALGAVREAVKSGEEKTHEAGVRALAGWPDVSAAGDLLTLAKGEENKTLAILSLRGYVRVVGLPSKRAAGETVGMLKEAMAAAKRPEERKMVLGGLGEVKDVKALEAVVPYLSEEGLKGEAVVPYLSEEGLKGEACAAAIKISREVWEKNKGVVRGAMGKVLEVSQNEGQRRGAKEILEKIDPPGGGKKEG